MTTNRTAVDGLVTAVEMINRMVEACREIIERETADLSDEMDDPNCYGAGWAAGAIATAREILACLEEETERLGGS